MVRKCYTKEFKYKTVLEILKKKNHSVSSFQNMVEIGRSGKASSYKETGFLLPQIRVLTSGSTLVTATAGGLKRFRHARNLANITIVYFTENFVYIIKKETDEGDIIPDPVRGEVFDRSRKCIAPNGRISYWVLVL